MTCLPNQPGRMLLARAFWVLALFTFLFIVAFPALPSEAPSLARNRTPAFIVLALGVATWLSMLVLCVRAFRAAPPHPSLLSSVVFFLFFAAELALAAIVLARP